jgi:hypothetical protein
MADDVTVVWDDAATAGFISGQEHKAVSHAAESIGDRLRAFGPVRTGALIASVREIPGADAIGVFEDVSALGYEVFQNPSHRIYHPSTGTVHGRTGHRFGFYEALDTEAAAEALL